VGPLPGLAIFLVFLIDKPDEPMLDVTGAFFFCLIAVVFAMREKGGSPTRACIERAAFGLKRQWPACHCTTSSKDLVFLASILDSHRATRAIPFGCGRRPLFANRVGMSRRVLPASAS
jgi:hypothetical protein